MSVTLDVSPAEMIMCENKVMSEEDKHWLDLAIPKIAENIGSFGQTARYKLVRVERRIMSDIYFIYMFFTTKINLLKEMQSLVIKKTKDCVLMDVECQFRNEIVFYQMFYQPGENFPKCFYTHNSSNSGDYTIIALEDVSKNGFEACPVSYDAPYNYVLAVARALGQFHAKGYILKEKNQTKFDDIVDNIEETRYNQTKGQQLRQIINMTSIRAVEYLRKHGHDASFCDKAEALLLNAFEKVMMRVVAMAKSSQLSTICHGDATLDNMLFQPQSDGHFNTMLIDFGMLRYGTPVIDLSTFFCLTCTNDMIRDKLYDILTVYHLALTNYMLVEGVKDIHKYSYNAILKDYKEGCLFGFVIASFYLVHVLGYINTFVETEASIEERARDCKETGGENVSAMLAEMLLQMAELGCIEHLS